jgi:hypothetical protein
MQTPKKRPVDPNFDTSKPFTEGPWYWRHYNYPRSLDEQLHPLIRWVVYIGGAAFIIPPLVLVPVVLCKAVAGG